jgi:hypothetical protein
VVRALSLFPAGHFLYRKKLHLSPDIGGEREIVRKIERGKKEFSISDFFYKL